MNCPCDWAYVECNECSYYKEEIKMDELINEIGRWYYKELGDVADMDISDDIFKIILNQFLEMGGRLNELLLRYSERS